MIATSLFIVGVIGIVIWYTGGSIVLGTRNETPNVAWGADIRSASTAGSLALDRDAQALYDRNHSAYRQQKAAPFIYPPWYAMLMIPFSLIPFPLAFFVWTAIGVAFLLASVRLLEIKSPALVAVVVLATWAAFQSTWYGQTSFLLLFLLAAAIRLWQADRQVSAGIALALCAFKPHLLLGFLVLWLIDLRRWKTLLLSAAGATAALAVASEVWIPGSWRGFVSSIFDTGVLLVPEREVSLMAVFRLLLPNLGPWVWPLWGIAVAAVVAAFLATIRRWQGHTAVPMALAIVVSLLLSIHGLSYDWLVLVAAYALIANFGRIPEFNTVMPFLMLAALLRIGFFLTDAMLERLNWAIHTPPLLLLAAFVWLTRAIWQSPQSTGSQGQPHPPLAAEIEVG